MIITTMKHFIYEYAISKMFSSIAINFPSNAPLWYTDIRLGMLVTVISRENSKYRIVGWVTDVKTVGIPQMRLYPVESHLSDQDNITMRSFWWRTDHRKKFDIYAGRR